MRSRRHGDSPPRRQTRPARHDRTEPASVGSPHGQETAQDPHRLPSLPRLHPRQPRRERGTVTGEPSALKGARWVRREAARKRPRFKILEPRDLAAQPTLSPRYFRVLTALVGKRGWNAIDRGCGPLGGLAGMVGPAGRVVGVDVSQASVEQARAAVSALEHSVRCSLAAVGHRTTWPGVGQKPDLLGARLAVSLPLRLCGD